MARRKKSGKEKRFRSDPFRQLKGFAVSGEEGQEKERSDAAVARPPGASPPEAKDADFVEEMADLGVEVLEDRRLAAPEPDDGVDASVEEDEPASADEALFLSALKGMDTVFRDELPASSGEGRSRGA